MNSESCRWKFEPSLNYLVPEKRCKALHLDSVVYFMRLTNKNKSIAVKQLLLNVVCSWHDGGSRIMLWHDIGYQEQGSWSTLMKRWLRRHTCDPGEYLWETDKDLCAEAQNQLLDPLPVFKRHFLQTVVQVKKTFGSFKRTMIFTQQSIPFSKQVKYTESFMFFRVSSEKNLPNELLLFINSFLLKTKSYILRKGYLSFVLFQVYWGICTRN